MTRSRLARTLTIAVAVSCGSAAMVPWGSEAAARPPILVSVIPAVRPAASGSITLSVVATGPHPLAKVAAHAYRSLAQSVIMGWNMVSSEAQQARRELAHGVAKRIGVDPKLLLERWESTSLERQLVLFAALSQLGVPYLSQAERPGRALDCSGLTGYAWSMVGHHLPRYSRDQYKSGPRIDAAEAEPGDLVFYPGHVMMSLGLPAAVVHAPEPGRRVDVKLASPYRSSRWRYSSISS